MLERAHESQNIGFREKMSLVQGGKTIKAIEIWNSTHSQPLIKKELKTSPSGYAHIRERARSWGDKGAELPYLQLQKPHDMELFAEIEGTDSNDIETLQTLAERVTKGFYQIHRSGDHAILSGVKKLANGLGFWLRPFASIGLFVETLEQNSVVVGEIPTEKTDSRPHTIHFIFEKQRDRAEIALLEEPRLKVFKRKIS